MPLIAGPPDTLTPLSVGVVSDHSALVLRGSVNVAASVAREPEELSGISYKEGTPTRKKRCLLIPPQQPSAWPRRTCSERLSSREDGSL
jgi:hypothetical protein